MVDDGVTSVTCAAVVEIAPNVPRVAQVGLFAQPGVSFDAILRLSPATADNMGQGFLHGAALRVFHIATATTGQRSIVNLPLLAPAGDFPVRDVADMLALFSLGSVGLGKMAKAGIALGNASFVSRIAHTTGVAKQEQAGKGPFGWPYGGHMAYHLGHDFVKYRLMPPGAPHRQPRPHPRGRTTGVLQAVPR